MDYLDFEMSGDFLSDVKRYFLKYKQQSTLIHSLEVANEAKRIANNFNLNEEDAFIAGLLHDISVVIPNEQRIVFHQELDLEVLAEEERLPLLLHQKQSKVIANRVFQIDKIEILSAIECHTTLKSNPTKLDLLLFVADKVKWDRNDSAPYLEDLSKVLPFSLEKSAKVYIDWILNEELLVRHPWLDDANNWLENYN